MLPLFISSSGRLYTYWQSVGTFWKVGEGAHQKGALFRARGASKLGHFHDQNGHFHDEMRHFHHEKGHFYEENGQLRIKRGTVQKKGAYRLLNEQNL